MLRPLLAIGLAFGLLTAGSGCTGAASTPTGSGEPQVVPGEPATAEEAPAAPAVEAVADDAAVADAVEAPEPPPPPHEDPWLEGLMEAHPKQFGRLLADPERYRFQLLVTVIPPAGKKDAPTPVEHGYRVDAEYIYPASAIKTYAAVGALRVLQDLRAAGHRVGLSTPLAYCDTGRTRCTIDDDPSNVDGGTITVGHEIRKMQLVSNNVSFNRLYELVGHQEINELMWSLGFSSVRIQHRMYGVQDPVVQRATPRVELRPKRGKPVVIPAKQSELQLPPTPFSELRLGIAHIDDETGERVDEPLDFSTKNYASVRDMHRLTLAIARPELPGVPELGLTEEHREWLLKSMSDNPAESTNPVYEDMENGLRYKTMIGGMQEALPLARIRYVGKAGRAYGFHLDNAYIEDRKSGWAMVVTAVAYANANGVLNDNVYEYDKITRKMLRDVGELLARAVLVEHQGAEPATE